MSSWVSLYYILKPSFVVIQYSHKFLALECDTFGRILSNKYRQDASSIIIKALSDAKSISKYIILNKTNNAI